MLARLTLESGTASPETYDLQPSEIVSLGRSRENAIVVHDDTVSRRHAEMRWDNGGWCIHDLGATNHTTINGRKIDRPHPLTHGEIIGIGYARFLFSQPDQAPPQQADDSTGTLFLADELSGLYQFMQATALETEPRGIIALTLETIARRTGSSLAGFLNLDPDHPVSKMTVPSSGSVDRELSRTLTQRARDSGKVVWLHGQSPGSSAGDSLASYVDALCVPLTADGAPLGAVHVYKERRPFTEREAQFCEVAAGFAARILAHLRLCRILSAENSRLKTHSSVSEELIGGSAAMQRLRDLIARAGASDATVLIRGESGVGKELVANALHRASPRRKNPFVVANCAALTENLIASQLFGHLKGSFTGALANHAGYFQQADDGTLFLDEIGDMPLEGQVFLLRVLEGHPFRPVGAAGDVRTDVRVVAATNRELEKAIAAKEFRHDLFFRLNVLAIAVPALREHAEDISALAQHFLLKLTPRGGKQKELSPAALQRLRDYDWPGNVRELHAVLQRAVVMGGGFMIEPSDLGFPQLPREDEPPTSSMKDMEAWHIQRVLAQVDGNITRAAAVLGLNRETVARKIEQYGLGKG